MGTSPPWDLYRSFLAVMHHGTLSAAARAVGLTQPSVGRHVDALEEALGVVLFTRSGHGLTPTVAALEMVPSAEAMAASANALTRIASGEAVEESGAVRLTASEIMGTEVLPPILAAFQRQYPRIALEVSLTNHTEDLLRRDADIAVRHISPRQEALVARRIGTVILGLYAHQDYLQARGCPATLAELRSNHVLVGWDRETGPAVEAAAAVIGVVRTNFMYRCDSHLGQLAAVRAGLGIGVCQRPIAARDAALRPVLAESVRFPLDIWLSFHKDLRASRRVRLLVDHLATHLSAYVG